jgi:hypothetical protein
MIESDTLCSCCNKPLGEAPTDWGQGWPAAYLELSKKERAERATRSGGGDLVDIDRKRWFVRGVLYVPILDTSRRMALGLYAEMRYADVLDYAENYWDKTAKDVSVEWDGTLSATLIPMYPELHGMPVKVTLNELPNKRPNLIAAGPGRCRDEQQSGITVARWHECVRLMQTAA